MSACESSNPILYCDVPCVSDSHLWRSQDLVDRDNEACIIEYAYEQEELKRENQRIQEQKEADAITDRYWQTYYDNVNKDDSVLLAIRSNDICHLNNALALPGDVRKDWILYAIQLSRPTALRPLLIHYDYYKEVCDNIPLLEVVMNNDVTSLRVLLGWQNFELYKHPNVDVLRRLASETNWYFEEIRDVLRNDPRTRVLFE